MKDLSANMHELFSIAENLDARTQTMEEQLEKLSEQQQSTEKETIQLGKSLSQANHSAELDEMKAKAAEALNAVTATEDALSKQASQRQEMQNAIDQVQAEIDQQGKVASNLAQVTQDLAASFSSAMTDVSVATAQYSQPIDSPATQQPTRSQLVDSRHSSSTSKVARLADTPVASAPAFPKAANKDRRLARETPTQPFSKVQGSKFYPGIQVQGQVMR